MVHIPELTKLLLVTAERNAATTAPPLPSGTHLLAELVSEWVAMHSSNS
jgi:hypothetical protein